MYLLFNFDKLYTFIVRMVQVPRLQNLLTLGEMCKLEVYNYEYKRGRKVKTINCSK